MSVFFGHCIVCLFLLAMPKEGGQAIQWPKEEGQTLQWPEEEEQTIQ
jgi:hypothetical protein